MVKITLKSTGFFYDKPRVDLFVFKDDHVISENKKETIVIKDASKEEIEKWFAREHLNGTVVLDRLISIDIEKTS